LAILSRLSLSILFWQALSVHLKVVIVIGNFCPGKSLVFFLTCISELPHWLQSGAEIGDLRVFKLSHYSTNQQFKQLILASKMLLLSA